jgi:diguanylate cyclase (GGDEF)-like protein
MLDLERLTPRQHLLLTLFGIIAAIAIFAADAALGFGLLIPMFYVVVLLGYYVARVERAFFVVGPLAGVLTLVGVYLARGDTLTLTEAIDRCVFVLVLGAFTIVLPRALAYQRELRSRSATDELTGATQHLAFVDLVTKESIRARRYRSPFTLAVFEIDNLSAIAAKHGRSTRDRLLKALAEACAEGIRPTDLLGRIDDSLVAGLPETREIDAAVVAERLRQATFEIEEGKEGGGTVEFSVTAGIAAFTEDDDEMNEVLKRAHEALRQAQSAGGNRVSIAQDDVTAIA